MTGLKKILDSRAARILLILPRFIISLLIAVLYSILKLLSVQFKDHIFRGLLIGIAAAAGILFLLSKTPVIVLILICIIILIEIIFAFMIYQVLKEDWDNWIHEEKRSDYKKNRSNESSYEKQDSDWDRTEDSPSKGSLFEGLSPDMAKKEFRRLMKLYHPDNPGGDPETAKMVVSEYEYFTKKHGL